MTTAVLGMLRANLKILTLFNLGVSFLASSTLVFLAIFLTVLIAVGASVINNVGNGLSVSAKDGGPVLAIAWVSAVFSTAASSFWFLVWFVEFRRTAFARRQRTSGEQGNYLGILGEIRRDLRVKDKSAPSDKQEMVRLASPQRGYEDDS